MSSWRAERDIDVTLARTLVHQQFPQLAVEKLTLLGDGFDNAVYRLDDIVFRFPRRALADTLLQRELTILPQLSTTDVAVPRPLLIGEPSERFPHRFVGYTYVEGELTDGQPSEAAMAVTAERLALFLRELHRLSATLPGDELGRVNRPRRLALFDTYFAELQELAIYPHCGQLRDFRANCQAEVSTTYQQTVVHGDLHIANVVVDNEGALAGIIDWGDAHLGHRALDFSFAYSYLTEPYRSRFFALYDGDVTEEEREIARFSAVLVNLILLVYATKEGKTKLQTAAAQCLTRAREE